MIHALRGIDIGTTATKVILVDLAGQIVAETEKPATLHSPQAGWAEEDVNHWWANVCVAVPECLCMAGVEARQIAAVGASGMAPTVVLLYAKGQVLRSAYNKMMPARWQKLSKGGSMRKIPLTVEKKDPPLTMVKNRPAPTTHRRSRYFVPHRQRLNPAKHRSKAVLAEQERAFSDGARRIYDGFVPFHRPISSHTV